MQMPVMDLLTLKEILLFNFYEVGQVGIFNVIYSFINCGRCCVITCNGKMKIPYLFQDRFFYFLEKIYIPILPFLKGEFFSVQVRRNVSCYHGCFNQDGTTTTHRVKEITLPIPAR